MPLTASSFYGHSAGEALDRARRRDLLPTELGTAELRRIAGDIRRRAVFSARTTSAHYVSALAERINRLIEGGFDNDFAKLRLELKRELARLGYTPEGGFPGDAALGIPPAKPGSLRDLSSDRRINLILRTQLQLMHGAGQKARGDQRADQFPAYELVRISSRMVPRDWRGRWADAGGPKVVDPLTGSHRMIARKGDRIWRRLGSSLLFDDALDVDHPPFAFGSGMGWEEVDFRTASALNVPPAQVEDDEDAAAILPPKPRLSTSGLSPEAIRRLKRDLKAHEDKNGKLTIESILDDDGAPEPPPVSSPSPRPPKAPTTPTRATTSGSTSGSAIKDKLAVALKVTKKERTSLNRFLDVLDEVHGDGPLDRIPYTSRPPGNGSLGAFSHTAYKSHSIMGRQAAAPNAKRQNAPDFHPDLTKAHEVGHWLDFDDKALGLEKKPGQNGDRSFRSFATRNDTDNAPEEWREFWRAVKASDAYKLNREIVDKGPSAPSYDFTSYLDESVEIWARAYSQWVAVESGDADLRRDLDLVRDHDITASRPYRRQWNDEDFEPIGRAIRRIFGAKGWLRFDPDKKPFP